MSAVLKLNGITLPGSGYPKLQRFTGPQMPITAGLVGLYVLENNAEDSLYNYADVDEPLTVVGSPVVSSLGAVVSITNCFDTGILSASDMTVLSVARTKKAASSATGAMMVSNYGSSNPIGDSLCFAGGSTMAVYGGLTSATSQSSLSLSAETENDWGFFAGAYKANGEVIAYRGANGTFTAGSPVDSGTRSITTRTLRIGGHYNTGGSFASTATVGLVAIYHSLLTQSQIEDAYEYLRDVWGVKYGIDTL